MHRQALEARSIRLGASSSKNRTNACHAAQPTCGLAASQKRKSCTASSEDTTLCLGPQPVVFSTLPSVASRSAERRQGRAQKKKAGTLRQANRSPLAILPILPINRSHERKLLRDRRATTEWARVAAIDWNPTLIELVTVLSTCHQLGGCKSRTRYANTKTLKRYTIRFAMPIPFPPYRLVMPVKRPDSSRKNLHSPSCVPQHESSL